MIRTFACKSRKLPTNIQQKALLKLSSINAACVIQDLRLPLSNHLELLEPKHFKEWSIKINDQFRIVFKFDAGNAYDVRIGDYH